VTAALSLSRDAMSGLPSFLSNVELEIAKIPDSLSDAAAEGVLWQAAPGRFLLRVAKIAKFLIEAGCKITVEPSAEATDIARFLRMTPLAALLYQRGTLAMHAAAAANVRGAILLAGDSCAGKSTLLMALMNRGWKMLADELVAIDFDERGQMRVMPMFPEVRLWQDAEKKFAVVGESPNSDKDWRIVSVPNQFSSQPQVLRTIYWLTAHNTDKVEQHIVEGIERFRAVGTLTYNSHIADALLDRAEYMRQATIVTQTVPIHRLYRPRGKWVVEELADRIEAASV
jgi:hypothetical protein